MDDACKHSGWERITATVISRDAARVHPVEGTMTSDAAGPQTRHG
jgi:hypothetical protein